MSVDGIEPSTSVLSGQRSTTELHAHTIFKKITSVASYTELHAQKYYINNIAQTKQKTTQGWFFVYRVIYFLVFSASATVSASVSATSWWASFHRTSFVNSQFSSFKFFVIKHRNCFFCLFC